MKLDEPVKLEVRIIMMIMSALFDNVIYTHKKDYFQRTVSVVTTCILSSL